MKSRSAARGAFVAAAGFAAALAGGCGDAARPSAQGGPSSTSAPLSDEAGLTTAQNWLVGALTSEGSRLNVDFVRPAVVLARPCTIDVEYGSGHGGSLVFARLRVGDETTAVERLSYQAYRDRAKDAASPAGVASRAEAPTSVVRPFLDAVRALSRAQVTNPDDHGGGSSNDFFVLVRVCAAAPAPSPTWEFAGYQGDASEYGAQAAVVSMAQAIFDKLAWTPVAAADLRRTHFSDAFERNRDLCVKDFHWWVMERSVEALGWFGDRGALSTVVWLRDHGQKLNERQKTKLARVIESPDLHLAGPPRDVAEK
jgi:hypothetical protein